jgi:GNAT superfamily N-acetyltransferase
MHRSFRSDDATFTIRPWQVDDDDALRMLMSEHMGFDEGWPPAYARAEDPAQWLARPATIARWVAVRDSGDVVGHIGLGAIRPGPGADALEHALACSTADIAEICRTVVHPHMRAKGLAAHLTQTALRTAIEGGLYPVATVLSNRGTWLAMMIATGWREIHRAPSEVSDCDLLTLMPPARFIDAVRSHREPPS